MRNRRAITELGALVGRDAECRQLVGLLDDVRGGRGGTLVLLGEPGIGKSALLDHLCERARDVLVLRVVGVQAEQELAFAGLHQLLGTFTDRADALPEPQRAALRIAFGLEVGEPPAGLVVALAALTLLEALSAQRPVLCLVDDLQWLDLASTQVLTFIGRRLNHDQVGLVCAARTVTPGFEALPSLTVRGLCSRHARELLDSALVCPLDPAVRRQIVAEADGNPLALLELPRAVEPAELAGGYALPGAMPLSERIEASYRTRLERLPPGSRRLVQLTAADPVGDPGRLWAAAAMLGLDRGSIGPAVEDGLVVIGPTVRFAHPLARSAAYRAAGPADRRAAHAALAAVTSADADPDRRAWHLAESADGPDEEIARELARCAERAHVRGGLAAAAAFHRRSALLTADPADRAVRLITAAEVTRDAGALDAALDLIELVGETVVGERERSRILRLRGQIAFAQHRTADAVTDLLAGAARIVTHDPGVAKEIHLEALIGAMHTARTDDTRGIREVAGAIKADHTVTTAGDDVVALILEGLRALVVDGYQAAAPAMRRAIDLLVADPDAVPANLATFRPMLKLPIVLWDDDAWRCLVEHVVTTARRTGALTVLPVALSFLAVHLMWTGDLATAARVLEEARTLISATNGASNAQTQMLLVAWRGEEERTLRLSAEIRELHTLGLGTVVFLTELAEAVLFNGLGRFEQAHAVARRLFDMDDITMGTFVAAELADAASRVRAVDDLRRLDLWLRQRVRTTPGPWVLGVAERVSALLSEGDEAEAHYRSSIEHAGRTRVRTDLARSLLMFGEWLRRQGRRGDARRALRDAHRLFQDIGAHAFSERAARELRATGDPSVRDVTTERGELTAQEAQIAALAREGLSNPEIGARLFISRRTVQYHLRKVFLKLDITSRAQLSEAVHEQHG